MKPKDSDQSDNEGFVPNYVKIHSHNIHREEINHHKQKKFQPKYIVGEGLLRKEPIQIIKPFRTIQSKQRSYPCKKIVRDSNEELPTFHELSNNKNHYSLVYSRFKQAFGLGQRCAFGKDFSISEHLVKLNCCQNENQQNFRTLKDWDQKCINPQNFTEGTLVFDSLFEGGNLRCVFKEKKEPNTYVLFMQNDTNTYGYNQWFYFSIRNAKPKTKYTFKIANFKKSYSFFDNGLQPSIFSLQKDKQEGVGWYREGTNISYSPSNFKEEGNSKFYTLEFSIQFEYSNDYITISPNPPYSYSKLISTLNRLEPIANKNSLSWKLKSISYTVARNQVPYVIISNKSAKSKQKKKIVLLARQHSGEIWSSYIVEEIMSHLVQKSSMQAQWLLQNFDFHIFPMINVDGVIYGNFRCDIAGNDLNRTWKSPFESVQPQIYKIKKELLKLAENQSIQMCLDLHTHSRDYGAFGYCCVDNKQCRELPYLLSQATSLFRYGACTFGILGEKQYTARASVYGMTNNLKTITIELSAYGYKIIGRKYAIPYTPTHMITLASSILKSYYAQKNNIEPQRQVIIDNEEINGLDITQSFQGDLNRVDIPVEGSDSQPQVDQIELEVKIKQIYPNRFVEDLQYQKFKKIPKTNSNKYKRFKKQISNIKSETKTKEKTKVQISEVKQQTNASNTPIIFDQIISFVKEDSFSVQDKPKNTTLSNPKQSLYKKQSKIAVEKNKKAENQRPVKPLNLVEFSLKKLPIFPPQKITQPQSNTHILLNEPTLTNGFYSSKKQQRFDKTFSIYEAMCRPRVRIQSRKLEKDNSRLQHQLPFLCIMSETKKKMQMQKIKQKNQEKSMQKKQEVKYLINGHRPDQITFVRLRDKHKQLQLFSKIELKNFTRYPENTFFRKS